MRRDSWRSVAMMRRPPCALTCVVQALPLVVQLLRARRFSSARDRRSSASMILIWFSTLPPSTMSVPRPAMLVAIVITPGRPAWATISASLRVLLGVEHLVRQLRLLQQAGDQLGVLDRGRADQHRLAALVAVADVLDRPRRTSRALVL